LRTAALTAATLTATALAATLPAFVRMPVVATAAATRLRAPRRLRAVGDHTA
jgi:hypothetical protein